MIWAMGDTAFDNEHLLSELPKYVGNAKMEIKKYPNVSHWVAQEKPEEVGADLNKFIGSHHAVNPSKLVV